MTANEPIWTPERLLSYPLITDLDLSADATQIIYCVREPVMTDDESRFVSHLYRVPAAGGEPVRLTYRGTNTQPRWSPDGRHIAFLSDRDGKSSLYAMRADGGEPWLVVSSEKGMQSFRWSPDGERIALTMATPDDEARRAAKKAKDDPIRWGIDHDRARLWVAPFVRDGAKPAEPLALTSDDLHVLNFEWTDDGASLAFTHQPTPVADDWPATRLALVAAQRPEGEGQDGTAPAIRDLAPLPGLGSACLPHGGWIAAIRSEEPASWAMVNRVTLYPLDGGEPRRLAATPDAQPFLLGWSADGEQVYVLEFSGTSSAIRALPVNGGEAVTLIDGQGYITSARSGRHDEFAFVAQTMDRPNCVAMLDAGDASYREVVAPPMPDWPGERAPESRVIRWASPDGLEIEGLLTLPLDHTPGQPCPTLVIVHGGPAGAYSESYVAAPSLYPIATFAERGYAVLRPNPRGSSGYGAAFRTANRRDWGGGDYQDIMSGVDYLVEQGIADPQRLGIMGWSYGGYMTSWAITRTRRFYAASVGAGVTNLMSMNGTCDIPGFIPDYFGAEFWDDPDVYRAHSAMFGIKGVTTPTLIQHGDRDERVPLTQGKELYNALKRQDVPVEMDIYPRQPHGPNEPRLIMDIMRRNLEWFDRWLPATDAD